MKSEARLRWEIANPKVCTVCGKSKTRDEFRNFPLGSLFYSQCCKDCIKNRHKEAKMVYEIHIRNKKRIWLKKLRFNGCTICHRKKNLGFYHLNEEEKQFSLTLTGIKHKSATQVIEEVNKCVLLCRDCYIERLKYVHKR